ncbi:protocadherin-23 [Corythoichthys intestinalis]|uniref:protocadherin-23 n=1 Tax=Corythoichthys intestinalis TaxID=161448 RepID=UPI0025A5040C|nr:protocadherin-23 [Corythoichthys intestinalis]
MVCGRVVLLLVLLCAPLRARVSELTLSIPEGLPAGTVVGDLAAALSEPAAGFLLSESGDSQVFRDLDVRPDTGLISTATVLDRETRGSYEFAAATLAGEVVRVRVRVEDVNDHSPEFSSEEAELKVSEAAPPGARFHLPGARDRDEGERGVRGYRISESLAGEIFRLEPQDSDLELVLERGLDREARDFYALTVEAFDGGVPARIGRLRVNVTVLDENDNPPAFQPDRFIASVLENAPVGTSVCRVSAVDPDAGDNGRINFSVERRQSDNSFFSVDETTGVLYLNEPLDFETQAFHEVMVTARDNGVPPESSSTLVLVTVENVNDNGPVIETLFLGEDGGVSEAAEIGHYVARVSVSDPDDPGEAPSVRLEGDEGKFLLEHVDRSLYALRVGALLDREEKDLYRLRVLATDFGSPPLSSEALFPVRVTDVNDCSPVFEEDRLLVRVSEDVPEGTSVVRVEARDSDLGVNADVRYFIPESECPVGVDAETGLVTTVALLDREAGPETCRLLVVARDGGEPARSATATVTLLLDDVNDNRPVFRQSLYRTAVTEHAAPGTCFLQVAASDADTPEFGVLVYSLPDEESDLFRIHPQTGELCVSGDIDRDVGQSVHHVRVRAEDPGGLKAHAWARVEIQDLNDNAPVFTPERYFAGVGAHTPPGSEILTVVANDADDGAFGRVTYRLLPGELSALFALDEQTGTLYLTSALSHLGSASIELAVAARDAGGLWSAQPARVTVDVSAGAQATFRKSRYAFTVAEDAPPGTSVGSVQAVNSPDSAESVSYHIAAGDPQGLFAMDAASGLISTAKPLDRETQAYALLYVQAYTPSSMVRSEAQVHVSVADINDAAPIFHRVQDAIQLSENTALGATVYVARARDYDDGANGHVTYHLKAGAFAVNPDSGTVTLNRSLKADPPESKAVLKISARDGGNPPRSATLTLSVKMVASSPGDGLAFEAPLYRAEVAEDARRNSGLIRVSVRGAPGVSPLYSLEEDPGSLPPPFGIHPQSGRLYLRDELDYERERTYRFRAVASAGGARATAAVEVLVLDVDDSAPVFNEAEYFAAVTEGPPPRGPAVRVTATDRDSGENARLSYVLLSGVKFFRVHAETGEIFNWVELDREQRSQHTLEVMVSDRGSQRHSATARVHVLVTDVNDNPPRFVHPPASPERHVQISSGIPKGSLVTNVFAKDLDAGENGTITFTLLSVGAGGESLPHFEIDGESGDITTTSLFERSVQETYLLRVTAKDGGSPPLEGTARIHLQVYGSEERASSPVVRHLRIREDASPGPVIGSVGVPSLGKNIDYSVMEDDEDSPFGVDSRSGDVYVRRPLDYEATAQYSLVALAEDRVGRNITLRVLVTVEDANDHTPWFPDNLAAFALREDAPLGSLAFAFCATDGDGTYPNGALHYSVASPPGFPFLLDPRSGRLTVAAPLDRRRRPTYTFTVTASDRAERPLERRSASITARVFLLDVGDKRPTEGSLIHRSVPTDADHPENRTAAYVNLAGNQRGLFTLEENTGGHPVVFPITSIDAPVQDDDDERTQPYHVTVPEDAPIGTTLLTFSASDPENTHLDYVLSAGNREGLFRLKSETVRSENGTNKMGRLVLHSSLDRETADHYVLTVRANRRGTTTHPAGYAVVTVTVSDRNDNPPLFFSAEYRVRVAENAPAGTGLVRVSASDLDAGVNAKLRYDIVSGNGGGRFRMNPGSGLMALDAPLDYEEETEYILTVRARDGGDSSEAGNLAFTTVFVAVSDENDNGPFFAFPELNCSVSENLPTSTRVCSVQAVDKDTGAYGRLTYSVLSSCPEDLAETPLAVDPRSGDVRTLRSLDYEHRREYCFVAEARDAGDKTATVRVRISVKGEDEFDPVFTQKRYRFFLPEGAEPGRAVGFVTALDGDGGAEGKVEYSLLDPSPFISVDKTLGAVYALGAAELSVFAASPRPGSRKASCRVSVEVSGPTWALSHHVLGLSVSLAAVLFSLLVFAGLVLRSKVEQAAPKKTAAVPDLPDRGFSVRHMKPVVLTENRHTPSDRSGRGSAEGESVEDQEIQWINGGHLSEKPLGRIRERNSDGDCSPSPDEGYAWERLLDWEPGFRTLASVFADIGMLPDRGEPPPLITSVARPGLRSVRPRPPLARNTGLTPTAMTPTFSPSLSSLTVRSPGASPVISDTRLDSGPPTASLLEAEIQV